IMGILITGSRKARQGRKSKNMPTTEVGPAATGEQTHFACAVCPHAWDAHDPIGIRYCSATVAGELHRGCVCVGTPVTSAAGQPAR
ncbi:MAG: hypothetical protein QOH09_3168, partial [Pseudonocardiales bacterium]|nr:hypothetical protein [Pseudonocardiales bacterium]